MRINRRTVAIVVAVLLALVVVVDRVGLGDVGTGDPATISDGLTEADVVRAVDGDTIIVNLGGTEERLRYIGIDAPESAIPGQTPECFGPESSDENERLVGGEMVLLEEDASDRDQFGRLLRYVYLEAGDERLMVNESLVENGYAEAVRYPPDTEYAGELERAEEVARANQAGMWAACQ